jgi:ribose transport system ATP-binding protein
VRAPFAAPREALAAGMAFVPPDRRGSGLAEPLAARENLYMRPAQPWWRPLRALRERTAARAAMRRFHVHPGEPDAEVTSFSGGNQQKILLAKWLLRRPRLAILNEPTAGVDLRAKADIHQLVRDSGGAVLVISSDFAEVAQVCDRVHVMRRGRIVAELSREDATAHRLVALAYGEAA